LEFPHPYASFVLAAQATAVPGRTVDTAVRRSWTDHRGRIASPTNPQLSPTTDFLAPTGEKARSVKSGEPNLSLSVGASESNLVLLQSDLSRKLRELLTTSGLRVEETCPPSLRPIRDVTTNLRIRVMGKQDNALLFEKRLEVGF
jgi:hypothetical protein